MSVTGDWNTYENGISDITGLMLKVQNNGSYYGIKEKREIMEALSVDCDHF